MQEKRTRKPQRQAHRHVQKIQQDGNRQEKLSAARDAACPHSKACGGCDYQGIPYEEQLRSKQSYMRKLLQPSVKVCPIVGMENPYHYRCKVQAAFDYVKGSVVAGEYRKNSHEVVDLAGCQIENEEASAIIQTVKRLIGSFRIRTYNADSGYGLLRHVLVRVGYHSGEIMVVLVLSSPILPSKNNFVKALRREHPRISTVVINVNDKRTSMVLGERNIVVYGRGYIEDELCGLTFRISPNSFYQVNPKQTELLYRKAIAYAGLSGRERVIDAYCGTGTIGLVASQYAQTVIGVELNRDAVRDAVVNAKRNNIKNIRFYNEDAGQFMTAMAQRGEQADVVILDPPRAGSDEAFLRSVVKLGPQKIVYVSCGPESLARDLNYLTKHGYRAEECTPFDCFPFTKHIECVVLLSHKKPDSVVNVKVEFSEGEGKVPFDNIAKRAVTYKPKERVTYKMIKEYIEAKYGFKVHTEYIAEVKRELGLPMYDAPNAVEELKQPRKHLMAEKVEAIKDALKHFEII